jgi:hypothetical protein
MELFKHINGELNPNYDSVNNGFHWSDSSQKSEKFNLSHHEGAFSIGIRVFNSTNLPAITVKLRAYLTENMYIEDTLSLIDSSGNSVSNISTEGNYFFTSDPDFYQSCKLVTNKYELILDNGASAVDAYFQVVVSQKG